MLDLPVHLDPLATDRDLANPPASITFPDGVPFEYRKTPTSTAIDPEIIAQVERAGAACKGFFGNRSNRFEALK